MVLKVKHKKLKVLLAMELETEKIGLYSKLLENLNSEIERQKQLFKESPFNQAPVEGELGEIIEGYYEEHKRWYFAEVVESLHDTQQFKVSFLSNRQQRLLLGSQVKKLNKPKAIEEGQKLGLIMKETGKVVPVTVREILSKSILVGNQEGHQIETDKRFLINLEEEEKAKIPGHMKILPTDPKHVRIMKKRKIQKTKYEQKNKELKEFLSQK